MKFEFKDGTQPQCQFCRSLYKAWLFPINHPVRMIKGVLEQLYLAYLIKAQTVFRGAFGLQCCSR